MPCYDARDHEPRVLYEDTAQTLNELTEAKRKLAWTEGALCAIISNCFSVLGEEETYKLLHRSGEDGSIRGLKKWWQEHKEKDKIRYENLLADNPLVRALFDTIEQLGAPEPNIDTSAAFIDTVVQLLPDSVSKHDAMQIYLLLLNK